MSGSTIPRPAPSPASRTTALRWERGLRPTALVLLAAIAALVGCGGDVESRMAEVRALQDVGQYESSIEELREILTIAPDLPEANYRLGLALVQTGEASRAVWPLQKASESSEYAITAGLLLASTHLQTKNYDESVRAANRVLENDPDRVAALRVRAMANLVGRKLDDALADTTRLKELAPDDYAIRALHATVLGDIGKHDEAEKEHQFVKQLGQESDDPNLRVRACLAPAVFASEVLQDKEKARPLYEDCAQRNPTDLVTLNHIAGFFDKIGEPERATQMIRTSAESAPERLELQTTLADRLLATGDVEGAEKVLKDSVESFGSAQAWNALATFHRGQQQPERALEAIEKVLELSGGGSEQMRFTHADILLDLREMDRAREVLESLEQPAYANLIRGRIALLSGDPKSALAAFDKGINAWPTNSGARFLAGLAARDLGDYERAVEELREAVRSGDTAEAPIELARILIELGRYQEAVGFATRAASGPARTRAEPYILGARAMAAQGQLERARAALAKLKQVGFPARAAAEQAVLEREAQGEEAALAFLDHLELDPTDPENLPVLQQRIESLSALGRRDEALAEVDAALATTPESHELYELRGLVLARAGDGEGSAAAFEKAIEIEPDAAEALAGLATVTANAGDPARAIDLFDRAYAADPTNGRPAYSAAQLSLVTGKRDQAVTRLRDVVKQHPGIVGARNDLAWLLAEDGDELDLALSLAQDARERTPTPEVLDTLGFVHLRRGETDRAIEVLEQAVAGRPESPSIRYHLGTALRDAGEAARAREMFEAALEMGAFPEADQARAELARLGT